MGLKRKRKGKGAGPSEGVPPAATAVAVEGEGEDVVKWLKRYSSMHSILTVGDGDFSFSLSLASGLGSGALMVATSLDTYEVLISKYSDAKSNIMKLKKLETTILHGVDVKNMRLHTDLKNRRFDRIVFNFPHAGFHGPEGELRVINLHKKLLKDFFCNARHLLLPDAEIHVRNKTGRPYDKWDLDHLASEFSLIMFEKEVFQIADYPGYNQKRGEGARCDQPFPLGTCCTFKFKIRALKKRKNLIGNTAGSISSLGGSSVHRPRSLETETRPLHLLPAVQAWSLLQIPPAANTVGMLTARQPYIAAQKQQPAFPLLNLDGVVRAPFHQQPMFSISGSSPNTSRTPGGIPPPMGRTAFPNLLALSEQARYYQRSIANPPGGDNCSYFERQRHLQMEPEVRRKGLMPGATGSSYSSALLEQCLGESPQGEERLNRTIAYWLSVKDRGGDYGDSGRGALMPGAIGLSYSTAFLEQCRRERLDRTITYWAGYQ